MIHELREYVLTRSNWEPYWTLFNEVCMPIRQDAYGVAIGAWKIIEGDHVRFVHLWEYDSLEGRREKRAALAKIPAWSGEFLPKAAALIESQTSRILAPVRPWTAPVEQAEVFFTALHCRVGKARLVADASDAPGEAALGVWVEEFSDPNRVVLLSTQRDIGEVLSPVTHAIRATETQRLECLKIKPV